MNKAYYYNCVLDSLLNGHGHAELVINNKKFPIGISDIRADGSDVTFEGTVLYYYDVKRAVNMVHGHQHSIKKVIFNNPATIVLWSDGTKTVVKCQEGDIYDPEKGLAMAISKKALGNKGNFNEVFKKWLPDEEITALEKAFRNAHEALKKFGL